MTPRVAFTVGLAALLCTAAPAWAQPAETDAIRSWFDHLRGSAIRRARTRTALSNEGLGKPLDPAAVERLQQLKIEFYEKAGPEKGLVQYDPANNRVLVYRGIMSSVDYNLDLEDIRSGHSRQRVMGFLLGEEIARAAGFPNSGAAHQEAVRMMEVTPRFRRHIRIPGESRPYYSSEGIVDWELEVREAAHKLQDNRKWAQTPTDTSRTVPTVRELEDVKRLRGAVDWRTASKDVLAERPDAIFEAIKEGVTTLALEEKAGESEAKRAELASRVRSVELEVVVDPKVELAYDAKTHKVRLTSGYLDAFRGEMHGEFRGWLGAEGKTAFWSEALGTEIAKVAGLTGKQLWQDANLRDGSHPDTELFRPAERVEALKGGTYAETLWELASSMRHNMSHSQSNAARRSLTMQMDRGFESMRERAIAGREAALANATTDAEREAIRKGIEDLRTVRFAVDDHYESRIQNDGKRIVVSKGLLDRLSYHRTSTEERWIPEESRMKLFDYLMGRELGKVSGLKAPKALDTEGLRLLSGGRHGVIPLTDAEIREASFLQRGANHYEKGDMTHLEWLRSLVDRKPWSEVPPNSRHERSLSKLADRAGEPDRYAAYRRADGTLDWKRMTGNRATVEALGLAHFGLALFLKEVAVVAATGDRARIEEFFDGLKTTEFYKHYGLFIAGARIGEVAYVKYLERFVRPGFVNGLLKTNLVLAAGLALPMIVDGQFSGKVFVISLSSLGISTAAVRSGVAGLKWVKDLKTARNTGALAKVGAGAGRLARMGGWFYTAAELAVILLVAEKIETAAHEFLDHRAARKALAEASEAFLAAAGDPATTPESLAAAADAYRDAWTAYRNFLYRPLEMDELMLAARLQKVARAAKLRADERKAMVSKIPGSKALADYAVRSHGSVENYADHLLAKDEREIQAEVDVALASYNDNREKHLDAVYNADRRDSGYLLDVDNLDWVLGGSRAGAEGDPYNGRNDVNARKGRESSRRDLARGLARISHNRLQTYEDEASVLARLAARYRSEGRDDLADVIEARHATALALLAADNRLINGDGGLDAEGMAGGVLRKVAGE